LDECLFSGGSAATLTDSLYLDAELLDAKAGGHTAPELHRSNAVKIEIGDGVATSAHKMMMRNGIGIDAPWALVMAYVAKHAGLHKGLEVFVDGSQRNRGQILLHLVVDLLRRVMAEARYQRFVDFLPLMGGRQIVLAAQIAKFAVGGSAHIYQMIIFIKSFISLNRECGQSGDGLPVN